MQIRSLSGSERLDWIRLIRTETVGPVTFRQLLDRYGTVSDAIAALPDLAAKGGRRGKLRIPSRADAEREIAAARASGAEAVAWCEAVYPRLLAALDDAPPILFVRGALHLLDRPAVAVVGARNASANGRRFAETLSRGIGATGLVVVSGLARGIDTAAHGGALDSGTVAVMAGGVDVVYPPENEDLFAAIGERGVVVAESPVGTQPQARHFPRRNRIISGLSLGVVVVEAAIGSGSLITARLAAEQGREVMAVPGSPLDPRCRGANALIRDGATLIESANDVLSVLAGLIKRPLSDRRSWSPEPLFPAGGQAMEPNERARREVVEQLGPEPVSVDELIRQCHLSPPVVMTVLLELELAGRLDRHPGNRVSLALGADP